MNATITAPSTAIIPAAQLRAVFRLAAAYHHEWAAVIVSAEVRRCVEEERGAWLASYNALLANGPARAWSADAIEKAVEAAREANPPVVYGIGAPTVRADGYIVHETLTGRVYWSIRPDGYVNIDICRPAPHGTVLSAEVFADGTVRASDMPATDYDPSQHVPYYQRHLDALTEAINAALTGACYPHCDAALAAVAPLFAGVTPDEPVEQLRADADYDYSRDQADADRPVPAAIDEAF